MNAPSCRTLPITVEPCTGTLDAHSSTKNSSSNSRFVVSVKLSPVEVGAIVGELAFTVAGREEPYRLAVSATAVQQSFELIDASTSTALAEVGASRVRHELQGATAVTRCGVYWRLSPCMSMQCDDASPTSRLQQLRWQSISSCDGNTYKHLS